MLTALAEPPESVLDLLHQLLVAAHDHAEASSWTALKSANADVLEALRDAVGAELPDLLDTAFSGANVAAAIEDAVAKLAPPEPVHPLVLAVACARALDDRYERELSAEWKQRVDGATVQPGSITMRPDSAHLESLLPNHRLAAGQGRAAERCDATAHACLFTPDATVPPIEIRTDLEPYLQGILHGATSFASCHPNQSIAEWTGEFPLQAREEVDQPKKVLRLAELAVDRGAAVVVLPELAGDPATSDLLRAKLRPSSSALVVAGSGHVTAGGERMNRCHVWVATAGGPLPSVMPIVILKRVPYEGGFGDEGLSRVSSHLSVFVSGPWRLVVGICRDVLDEAVRSALQQLGVNLVVVPAASLKTANFFATAASVATTPGFALVSNGPRWWGDLADESRQAFGCVYGAPVEGASPVLQERVDAPAVCFALIADHTLDVQPLV